MTRIIDSLSQIGGQYDALFCDLWGCLHNGKRPYAAAVAALQGFRQGGGKVVLLTNAPRPHGFVVAQLDAMGVPRDAWDLVVSSGDAAQDAMLSGAVGRRIWHIGPEKDAGFFGPVPPEWQDAAPIESVPLAQAQGIVCTGLVDDLTETPEDYRAQLMLAREAGLAMLCANPDIVVDLGESRIYCAGALAQLYEELGGTALYFGKPHPPVYERARRLLNLREGAQILAIGDGILTDILGARQEGIDSLFVTGGLAAPAMGPDVENPDPALLEAWLAEHGQSPEYSIGRLR